MPVEMVRRDGGKKFPARRLKEVALAILDLLGRSDTELSLALIGDREMQQLNAQYRGKNYPTDVLSFPVESDAPLKKPLLGDVVICVDKAAEQARERRRTLDEEMVTLLIHGIVHLMGYDHEQSAKDAKIMTRLEKKILRQLCERELIKV
ncbi:MAG TPA: rRNA maturation RNase YbeY [Terriglobales bacterium]|jgi:probable rRNA maturation factor|nr:rRNA maturation RNase YbeY [Terriglobales bacterium]